MGVRPRAGRQTKWNEGQIERAARQLKDGTEVRIVAGNFGCSSSKLRTELKRAKGEDWWTKTVRRARGGGQL